ncbi:MAG: monofunctional biosynthetic peptidoglycan transglycosylase [Saprospiraceae bacterium]|nr:monofunctional biosynthetic peptidoglycan transglycosylase [Saprospiraceae bacterium]
MAAFNFKSYFLNYYKDFIVACIILSFTWVLLYRLISPPITIQMLTRTFLDKGELRYDYVSIGKISPYLQVCAMASEDQNLPFHSGLDLGAIRKAVEVNKKGKKVFGASTITQQVAKNVFLFPQRSYIRKGLEFYFTLLIETFYPKEKILELYLNVAEMGTLIFGAEAAARTYYNKPASKLSLQESASIISILPNPRKFNAKNPSGYIAGRQSEIKSLYFSLDGMHYLRELYVKSESSLYDFKKYK